MVPIADCRFKFSGSQWVPAGGAEPQSLQNIYIHPDSPALGSHWQAQPINFNKTKLTNNTLDSSGHVSTQQQQHKAHSNFKCRFSRETMIEYLRHRIVWKSGLRINRKSYSSLSRFVFPIIFDSTSTNRDNNEHFWVFVLILWQIVLTSMHKYEPRIHIVRTSDPSQIPWSPQKSFGFAETSFVAVTAYQVNESTNYLFDMCVFLSLCLTEKVRKSENDLCTPQWITIIDDFDLARHTDKRVNGDRRLSQIILTWEKCRRFCHRKSSSMTIRFCDRTRTRSMKRELISLRQFWFSWFSFSLSAEWSHHQTQDRQQSIRKRLSWNRTIAL